MITTGWKARSALIQQAWTLRVLPFGWVAAMPVSSWQGLGVEALWSGLATTQQVLPS
jgi:hypothetical protein